MSSGIKGGAVVHGAIVQPRLEDGSNACAAAVIIEVAGRILSIAAPCEISVDVPMLRPPAIPLKQRREGLFQQPALPKLPIDSEYCDGADRGFRPVETLPVSAARVVRDKSFIRRFPKSLDGIGVGKIAISYGSHGGREEGVPIEDDVATPAHAPDAADWRDHPMLFGFEDRVPTQRGLNCIGDRLGAFGALQRLLIRGELTIEDGLYLLHRMSSIGGDRNRCSEIYRKVWTVDRDRGAPNCRLVSIGLAGAIDGDAAGGIRGLDKTRLSCDRPGHIPEVIDGEHGCGWQSCPGFRWQGCDKNYDILAIVCALHAPAVPLPTYPQIGVVPIPGMRPRKDLFR